MKSSGKMFSKKNSDYKCTFQNTITFWSFKRTERTLTGTSNFSLIYVIEEEGKSQGKNEKV